MLCALLLDLDDTLLGNPMEEFIPVYFRELSRFLSHRVDSQVLITELIRATGAMDADGGAGLTNEEAFAAVFYPAVGVDRAELEPVIARFYSDRFPCLRGLTRERPAAREIVSWARERGLQVAIATNPLFPRTAIEQRLEWAGLPVTRHAFDLVTTYENMHATKSRPAYYEEILHRLGRAPEECLMAGDSWDWDVVQPARVGIPAYWIAAPDAPRPDRRAEPLGQGFLDDLGEWLRDRYNRGS